MNDPLRKGGVFTATYKSYQIFTQQIGLVGEYTAYARNVSSTSELFDIELSERTSGKGARAEAARLMKQVIDKLDKQGGSAL